MARSEDTKTPLGIVSFSADLFKARERENGAKGYGCTILFDKTADISKLEAAALKACTEEWGDKALQWIKDGLIKTPFLDGDGKQGLNKKTGERHPGYAGRKFIRCTSGADYKPKVFDRLRNPVMDVDGCPSGSQVYAVVNAYTWDNVSNGKGVSFGISMVQVAKVATGAEVLGGGGGPDPDKFFEELPDEGAAPDSTKTGAGASGLFG
jgi:hypothetical protein